MTDDKQKRPYTMSDKALEQRRAASQAAVEQGAHTGPLTEEGKAASSRNAWKHGLRSGANMLWRELGGIVPIGKPCRTTCPKHPSVNPERPCTLILDGITEPGKDCLDRAVYLQAFDDLMEVMTTGEPDSAFGMLAMRGADAIGLIQQLREEIAEKGAVLKKPLTNKQGEIVGYDYVINPCVPQYTKLLRDLGINLPEMLATPRSLQKSKTEEDVGDAFTNMMQGIFNRYGKTEPRIIDHETGQLEE